MSLIIAEHISHSFGAQEVLKGVSFRVGQESRVGLIGPNGEGKTTLLRIIAGELEPVIGQVHRAKDVTVGYLPQDPPTLDGATIHGAMLEAASRLVRMERDLEAMAAEVAGRPGDGDLLQRYGRLQHEFEAGGGYSYGTRIEQILTGLAFGRETWERPLSTLSGGQRTRACLATLLLAQPDVLLLDEPTNHLDMDSVEWLEGWLSGYGGAFVIVSHDRYFLDAVTASTWEVAFGGIEVYRGAYSAYLTQREERQKELERRWETQQEYIAKTEEFIRIHLAGQRTREAQGRRTRLERFLREEAIARPPQRETMHLNLRSSRRAGDFVARAKGLEAGYEGAAPLFYAGDIEVMRGQRIALIGSNGAGKTTLLRTLIGDLPALEGEVRLGANVDVGYLSQTHAQLEASWTALEAVTRARNGLDEERCRTLLGSLLLSGDDVYKRVGDLSGGERSRVVLARLVVQGPNLLVLDEPTNHLDIPSTEIVEDVLRRYDGTLLFVSHDRRLVENVATDVWAIDGAELRAMRGGWQGYLAWREARRSEAAGTADGRSAREARQERKADFRSARRQANELQRLKRRHEAIEAEIDALEKELSELYDGISFAGAGGDVAAVNDLGLRYQRREERLKELWAQWEELGEKLE